LGSANRIGTLYATGDQCRSSLPACTGCVTRNARALTCMLAGPYSTSRWPAHEATFVMPGNPPVAFLPAHQSECIAPHIQRCCSMMLYHYTDLCTEGVGVPAQAGHAACKVSPAAAAAAMWRAVEPPTGLQLDDPWVLEGWQEGPSVVGDTRMVAFEEPFLQQSMPILCTGYAAAPALPTMHFAADAAVEHTSFSSLLLFKHIAATMCSYQHVYCMVNAGHGCTTPRHGLHT
jgi:hypothetical protein